MIITDPVPAAVTGLAATSTQGSCTITSNTVTCGIGIMAPGDTARITLFVTGTVDPAYTGDAIDNTATVTSPTPEPTQDPADGRSSTTQTDVSRQADLLVAKIPSAARFVAGTTASWTITVTNIGPSTATGTELTDTVRPVCRTRYSGDAGGSGADLPGRGLRPRRHRAQ